MTIAITFVKAPKKTTDTAVLTLYEDKKLSDAAKALDKKTGGLIASALKNSKKFNGKNGQALTVPLPAKAGAARAILLGLGKSSDLDTLKAEEAGGKLVAALNAAGAENVALYVNGNKKINEETIAAHIGNGINLRSYSFDRYKSKKKAANIAKLKSVSFVLAAGSAKATSAYKTLNHVTAGTVLARDLVNLPRRRR